MEGKLNIIENLEVFIWSIFDEEKYFSYIRLLEAYYTLKEAYKRIKNKKTWN